MISSVRFLCAIIFLLALSIHASVVQDFEAHTVTLTTSKEALSIRINYNACCYIDHVFVCGSNVVASATGVCSAIRIGNQWVTTRSPIPTPKVKIANREVFIEDINYAAQGMAISEKWHFTVFEDRIDWQISREYLNQGVIEDTYFPGWDFNSMKTWTGGLLDSGGVAWGRYLPENCSYGAHVGTVTFFNIDQEACLRITPTVSPGIQMASRFSHQPSGILSFAQSVTTTELAPLHDLHRFNRNLDVWAPFTVTPGTVQVSLSLQVLNKNDVQNRGTFVGLNGKAINNLLDTIGRYGVVDRRIMGGNGWLTGWVCLHEPFFAEMGLAIDDPAYTTNFSATLDEWRDHAQQPDGRIFSRWHHDTGDMMVPGTYNSKTGFYECGWGYTLDSQPDYVINVAEQFDLNGDIAWLRTHKKSCEQALDWLLSRDSDGNGLVEMMNDSHTQKKSSDWVDVVWASWENALVNAALYEALTLWSERERILNDPAQCARYRTAAEKLRTAFKSPISQGGFWNPEKGWFVYWRDRDGSIHGDNLVTPVNFCAIAYGLAEKNQCQQILDGIEKRMREENLFHWPLCFLPYGKEEGKAESFPEYENGDIFLSWGEVAIRSYASYDPGIAVAYIQRVLDRYEQDGLSFQRYLRRDQKGAGDDILAGNCMTIVGLYRNIFGIRPQWNRLQIDPHLTPDLDGTRLNYSLRGQLYQIVLGIKQSSITASGITTKASGSFGVNANANQLQCFQNNHETPTFTLSTNAREELSFDIDAWPDAKKGGYWKIQSPKKSVKIHMTVSGLTPEASYHLKIDDKPKVVSRSNTQGELNIEELIEAGRTVTFRMNPQ